MTKIAAIQMCSSHLVEENLETAGTFIKEAAAQGAKLVVLPEMFSIMGSDIKDKIAVKEKFHQGKVQDFLSQQAISNNIWIVGGTIPIECEDQRKVKAASILFNNRGQIIARYDKMHLFDVTVATGEIYQESDTTSPGQEIVAIETPFGKLGLAVCYDIRFPELFRCLFNKGVEIFIVPAAFTAITGEAHWKLLARSRAVENLCYFVGACQGGTHSNGRKTYGHSLIIGPWGNMIAEKDDEVSGVICADIDLEKLHEIRLAMPVHEHQRIFCNASNDTRLRNNGNNNIM